jgi:hypothetical protein
VLGLLAARASNGAGRSAGGDGGGTTPTGIRTKIERRRDVSEDSLPANRRSLILKKKNKKQDIRIISNHGICTFLLSLSP